MKTPILVFFASLVLSSCDKDRPEKPCLQVDAKIEVPDGTYDVVNERLVATFRVRPEVDLPEDEEPSYSGLILFDPPMFSTVVLNRLLGHISIGDSLYVFTGHDQHEVDVVHDFHRGEAIFFHKDTRQDCPNGLMLSWEDNWPPLEDHIPAHDHVGMLQVHKNLDLQEISLRIGWTKPGSSQSLNNPAASFLNNTNLFEIHLNSWQPQTNEFGSTTYEYAGVDPTVTIDTNIYYLQWAYVIIDLKYRE